MLIVNTDGGKINPLFRIPGGGLGYEDTDVTFVDPLCNINIICSSENTFSPIDTGTTSLTDKEKVDLNEITNSVFKLKIKITGVNVVNNKNEYVYVITNYENMNKYSMILNKFKKNIKVFNSSLLDNKINSYFIFK
jgi:hypothetical protein